MPNDTPLLTRLLSLLIALPLLAPARAWSDDPSGPQGVAPQPVSPGAARDTALTAETCPTFSWGAVAGAERYELAIYDAQWNPSTEMQTQQDSGEPLRAIAIEAPATAWTPAADQCLQDGAGYVWFVRAQTAEALGPWSAGARFEIDFGSDALSEAVRRELAAQLKQPQVWREGLAQAFGGALLSSTQALGRTSSAVEDSLSGGDSDTPELSTAEALSLLSPPAPQAAATSFPNPAAFKTSGPNGVVLGGTFDTGGIPAEGGGTRFMWYPGKAALRAGYVLGDQWDDGNVGPYSVAMGNGTTASGSYSTAMGTETTASDVQSTAMGVSTTASGFSSTAMGYFTTASGSISTAMGTATTASGFQSTAMGIYTTASGSYSTAMGIYTTASGDRATAMGRYTTASGDRATAMGRSTTAQSHRETALGSYNDPVSAGFFDPDSWVETDRLLVIGNGTSDQAASNALVMLKNGRTAIGNEPAPLGRLHVQEEDIGLAASAINTNGDDLIVEDGDALLGLYSVDGGNYGSGVVLGEVDQTSEQFTDKWAMVRTTSTGTIPGQLRFTFGTNANHGANNTVARIESNGDLRIDGSFINSGADYAEYLPLKDPEEPIEAGDIVAVVEGTITRDTRAGEQLLVVSERPTMIGNAPGMEAGTEGLRPVAFLGQVEVKVRGPVRAGDLILASGHGDGTGIAVAPAGIANIDTPHIVGRAWSGSQELGLKTVVVSVGLGYSDVALRELQAFRHAQEGRTALIEALVQRQAQAQIRQREQIARLQRENAQLRQVRVELDRYRHEMAQEMALLRVELRQLREREPTGPKLVEAAFDR